jgi:uncharacterized protein YgiM (DUF1202 family)
MQARASLPVRPAWTRLSVGREFVLLTAVVLGSSALCLAQQNPIAAATEPVVTVGEPRAARTPAEPYVAEVTGNDVFIRSGPGTNFYQCGRLYAGDRVQVISSDDGWSCIVPPPGCFSWVSMRFVSINLENPTMGIITGDNVGVYAGSDFVFPMHSTSRQVVLNRGQHVRLLGEEKDDYYKIAPPQGAYLWVSSQYLQQTDRMLGRPPEVNVGAMVKASAEKPAAADPNVVPKTDLEIYYALAEQIKLEQTKPLAEQDYTTIAAQLSEIAAKQDAGRAARYAEYTLKQVERFELAGKAARELALLRKERQRIDEQISEARAAKLAQVEDHSRFALIGRLATSSVYEAGGPIRRYRLLDESGKTICYVTPTGLAANADYNHLMGQRVGLVGKIKPHEASARAFIEFTEAVPLD